MTLEIALVAIILVSMAINYFIAKKNGKLEERDRIRSKFVEDTAETQRTILAQLVRSDERMEKMEAKVYNLDIHVLNDPGLNKLWQADTESNVQTNPERVEKPKTEGT